MTPNLTVAEARKSKSWILVDAENVVLGRLASFVALRLKGKHKPSFSPHLDLGDFVVVINAEKVRLTGRKMEQKRFHWHTGHPGGIKETDPKRTLASKHPERLIVRAVERMLKKDSPLARRQMTHLKVYAGKEHPHAAQNPKTIDFAALNPKNKRSA
ncbi:MAG: 50S ribosomal protein L13 [Azospirillum sp.]|nr:50S ribosomal protein L13 [Azospirillum sp.]MCA3267936.1 50S ribosomal protein L13 [Azospirillum sp.]MCZ8123195.1 50S ribosomal protein L13 [Magnetospirillum sp.]